MSAAGRSRGRAKTKTEGQTPMPTETTQQRASVMPEGGRGRGLTSEPALPVSSTSTVAATTTTTTTTTGTVSPSGGGSSEESPPQQHSPPQQVAGQPLGRAALRGAPHQPSVGLRADIIDPLERVTLQDVGDVRARPARENRIESVLLTRPLTCTDKKGTSGTPVKILCNYFEVISQPNWVLYQYHVDFLPVTDSKKIRIQLLRIHDHLFPQNKAFDGSTLYTLTKLPDEVTELASTRESDGQIIVIKIKRVAEIAPTSPNFVHLFNLVFRRCLKLYGMQAIDRNYYDMSKRIEIQEYGLQLINGFSTSIASYENKLLLCAELTHKLLHRNTIFNLMERIFDEMRNSTQRFREKCTADIVGRIIMTTYNNKTYKIDDIDWDMNPTSTFETSRDGTVSFVDYYKSHYNLNISDPKQPLLVSLPSAKDKRQGRTAPILLIPEFCIITGVDDKMREDFRFKKAVEKFSKVGPSERCNRLSNFVGTFRNSEKVKTELEKWQMDFSAEPAKLDGRILPPESLEFGKGIKKQLNEKADWGNEMKGTALLKTVALTNWVVIYPRSKSNAACMFVENYEQVIRSMNIQASTPQDLPIVQDSAEHIVNALKQAITDKTQLVVIIVTSKRKDRYDAIKRICCLEKPVPSQVVTSQIIEDDKKRKSVVTKIAIQMNCKLGGEIWASNIPIKSLMICGIDTYHDSQKKKSSVCAFIATSNEAKTKYFSRATIQETHQELSNNLTITVKSALEHYYKVNNTYPEKIIIYRDGISDGQLQLVMEYEIPQIQKAFPMINPNYKPSLAFIVVKKRGNARFFAQSGRDLVNPPCGSIIDTVVTRAEWFDFYLISQHVTQGTVNPTHYNVIYDTIGLKAEYYQRLSFKLTHMYYNWPGTIRVPANCQYAHKLAFLVGQSLHKEHDSKLCDKLFFL